MMDNSKPPPPPAGSSPAASRTANGAPTLPSTPPHAPQMPNGQPAAYAYPPYHPHAHPHPHPPGYPYSVEYANWAMQQQHPPHPPPPPQYSPQPVQPTYYAPSAYYQQPQPYYHHHQPPPPPSAPVHFAPALDPPPPIPVALNLPQQQAVPGLVAPTGAVNSSSESLLYTPIYRCNECTLEIPSPPVGVVFDRSYYRKCHLKEDDPNWVSSACDVAYPRKMTATTKGDLFEANVVDKSFACNLCRWLDSSREMIIRHLKQHDLSKLGFSAEETAHVTQEEYNQRSSGGGVNQPAVLPSPVASPNQPSISGSNVSSGRSRSRAGTRPASKFASNTPSKIKHEPVSEPIRSSYSASTHHHNHNVKVKSSDHHHPLKREGARSPSLHEHKRFSVDMQEEEEEGKNDAYNNSQIGWLCKCGFATGSAWDAEQHSLRHQTRRSLHSGNSKADKHLLCPVRGCYYLGKDKVDFVQHGLLHVCRQSAIRKELARAKHFK